MADVDLSQYDLSQLSQGLKNAVIQKAEEGKLPSLPEPGRVKLLTLQCDSGIPDFPVAKAWLVIDENGLVLPADKH